MTGEITTFVLIFGTLLFAFGLASRKISETVITAPMIFVAAGMLLSPAGLGLIELSPKSSLVLAITDVALALTFFSDASRIGLRSLQQEGWLARRLLLLGLPLTIGAGAAVAAFFFTDLTLVEAALLGTILAPTDAGLGQKVVANQKVPVLIRQGLNIESGLNDGAVMPFFIFFLVLGTGEELNQPISSLFVFALEQVGIGILAGILLGLLGGWLSGKAVREKWMSGLYHRTGFVVLAIISWLVANELGGSGFVATFVAGLISGTVSREVTDEEVIIARAEGNTLSLAVLFILGVVVTESFSSIGWSVLAYAALSLTVIRVVPVALSLIGSGLNFKTVLFLGLFGPRGLASIVLLLITMGKLGESRAVQTIRLTVFTTVLISIFVHGITAGPASEWYSRTAAALPQDAQELNEVKELPTHQGFSPPGDGHENSQGK
jgi:NhaP-type Na+/H+ or K+/H+ antiporter